jgi:dihydrodiol dehydrogenase / D-xylose 1-dehydrogenase (NADP)
MSDIRWGIMGCGNIARQFAEDLRLVPGNRLTAVASATPGKAAAFAATHGAMTALDDYAALARREDVDAVYVATTHERHHGNALLALRAGRAVLCEKPITLNATQARELHAAAQAAGVFLMEAMWTRFIPAVVALLAELQAGVIGPVRLLQADFGIASDWKPDSRMVNKDLAGGALLDLGVYPLTFAQLVLGNPVTASASIRQGATGVDAQSSYLLGHAGGGQSLLMSAFDLKVPHQARIYGPLGRIVVDDFFHPKGYTVELHGQGARRVEHPFPGNGYQFEIAEVVACLREGRRESRLRPMADTIAVMEVMDRFRAQWGLRYPQE